MIYEIAEIPLQSASDILDTSTKASEAFRTVLDTLSQQPGWISNDWGFERENRSIGFIVTGRFLSILLHMMELKKTRMEGPPST